MENLQLKIDQLLANQNEIKSLLQQQTVSENFVNKETACAYLSYGSSQLAKLLKDGKIEYSRIGRRVFISKASLNQFIISNKAA